MRRRTLLLAAVAVLALGACEREQLLGVNTPDQIQALCETLHSFSEAPRA